MHRFPDLKEHQGVYLSPCRAVHSIGIAFALDIVFIDAHINERKRVDALRPYRFARCRHAVSVIELPGGYCQRYPDYLCRIRRALRGGQDSSLGSGMST